jgi:hypothetical protein
MHSHSIIKEMFHDTVECSLAVKKEALTYILQALTGFYKKTDNCA